MNITLSKPLSHIDSHMLDRDLLSLKKRNLDRFIRGRVPFFMDEYRYATTAVKERWGLDVYFFEAGHERVKNVWLDATLNEEAAALWLKEMDKDPSFTKNLIKELQDLVTFSKDLAKSVPNRTLSAVETEQFLFKHLDYWVAYFSVGFLWFSVDNISKELNERVKREWRESEESLNEFLNIAYRPMQFPLSSREQYDLLALKDVPDKSFEEALERHWSTYNHLAIRDIDDPPFTIEYFRDRLKILGQPKEYQQAVEDLQNAEKEIEHASHLIEESALSPVLKEAITFCRWVIYLRTETIDYWTAVNAAYKTVFQSLSQQFDLPIEEILHMTFEEIIHSVREGLSDSLRKQVRDRAQNGYAYLIAPHGSYLVTGKEIEELQSLVVPEGDGKKERVDSFKGQTAFVGSVEGIVRIILDRRHANELTEGEVLVTGMTTPEFVPAMKVSSAIITNEGGILCHAAILSRELRKPCIIGTKIATDVLKTGDRVLVDATSGIIKIIQRAQQL